jgi:hypothetical protein
MHPLYLGLMAEQKRNDLLSEAEAARNAALAKHQRKRRARFGRARHS